ncbi:MAG TPA: hypothetical protein PKD72_08670, partial [Gemmatales bacterium]|nr:hypothetical protein [Gemmatales bacterium]
MFQRIHVLLFSSTFFVASMLVVGCSNSKVPSPAATPLTSASKSSAADSEPASLAADLQDANQFLLTNASKLEEKYQQALLDALNYAAENKYPEAMAALEKARSLQDTELVREQIARVEGMLVERDTLERTLADIQAVIDQGQAEQALELVYSAMVQFPGTMETQRLMSMKRQADVLLLVSNRDKQ